MFDGEDKPTKPEFPTLTPSSRLENPSRFGVRKEPKEAQESCIVVLSSSLTYRRLRSDEEEGMHK